jgi:hypothetical protein
VTERSKRCKRLPNSALQSHGSAALPSCVLRRSSIAGLGAFAPCLSDLGVVDVLVAGRDVVFSYSLTVSTPTQLTKRIHLDMQTFPSARKISR